MFRFYILVLLILTTVEGFNFRRKTNNNGRKIYGQPPIPENINTPKPNECLVNIETDLNKNQPLIIRPSDRRKNDLNNFYMPDKTGIIKFNKGDKILFACTGNNNKLSDFNIAEILVTCDGNNQFLTKNDRKKYEIKKFNCTSSVKDSAVKNTKESCNLLTKKNNEFIIDIGFKLSNNSFYTIIQSCFDPTNSDVYYTKFIQTPSVATTQKGKRSSDFEEGSFYPKIPVTLIYQEQRKTIEEILESKELANKYINVDKSYYLSRGHLAANGDFIFTTHKKVTFYYINVAPQWQTLNGGNWRTLESNIRDFISKNDKIITIYTGTYGIATLPDINNNYKPLYLENKRRNIKVPELFWKILHDNINNKGIAFVAINNPYLSDYIPLCNDICNRIKWLKWKPNDQKLGYAYCCDVNELIENIDTIPNINVKNGLLI